MRKQNRIPAATYQNQFTKRELMFLEHINELKTELAVTKQSLETYKEIVNKDLPF